MKTSEGQLENTVCELLKKQCSEYVPKDKELLVSGVIGSFQLFELICELEEAFDIRFHQEDLKEISHFSSVNAITNTIKKYMA
ncbi:MAG TPA: hypothetical protein DCZ40_01740 [Lachnospiraceae bacterium]|nr:hypothetical protein [Lachnospiraceae bacterium]